MRIGAPDITRNDDLHVLSAHVSLDSEISGLPETLWFAVHDVDPCFPPGLADAFLVSLVATAMKLGEGIEVEGPVSSSLAHGVINYQRILGTWWSESFNMIDIDYMALDDRRDAHRPSGVGCVLPGGFDALGEFAEWLPGNATNPAYEITHAVMIRDSENAGVAAQDVVSRLTTKEETRGEAEAGIAPLVVYTNQEHFRKGVMSIDEQLQSLSSAQAACAHAMSGLIGRFSIPGAGSYAYGDLEPRGSHPALDHHLGSDLLQVIHQHVSPRRDGKGAVEQ